MQTRQGAKRARKVTVFSVSFTEYEDDYKHRYDNGVYERGPYVFSTRDKAEAFLDDALQAYVIRYLMHLGEFDMWKPFLRNEGRDYTEDSMYSLDDIDEFTPCLDMDKVKANFDTLLEQACKAEFVETKMEYRLDVVDLDDHACPF